MTRTAGLDVDGVLLDVDGVLATSWVPIPGAPQALRWLRNHGVPFRLLTNTTELSRAQLLSTLRRAGFDVGTDDVVTAPMATAAYVRGNHPHARCYVIGAEAARGDLEGIDVVDGDADVVIVGGASASVPWAVMNHALRLVLGGAQLVAMHRTMTWMTAEGMVIDAGIVLLAGLEEATGRRAVVCGKPAPECFAHALETLGLRPERAAMVGDDVTGDVLAAQAVGLQGVLVKTGKFRPEALDRARGRPQHVVGSVAELPALLEKRFG